MIRFGAIRYPSYLLPVTRTDYLVPIENYSRFTLAIILFEEETKTRNLFGIFSKNSEVGDLFLLIL